MNLYKIMVEEPKKEEDTKEKNLKCQQMTF